jgi:DEAD/DEAH box helicase domain-containing protein
MPQLDAIKLSEALRERLVDFSVDDNFVNDTKLREVFRRIWSGAPEQGGLVSELWIEGMFPSEVSGETLASLVAKNEFNELLCEQLDRRGAVPRERPLYVHQLEAVRKAQMAYPNGARPALVVTAGTGTGKTESFLLPVLNELFSRHTLMRGNGVQCLILYPMNALVNDQVDRLYTWLREQKNDPPITLFHFTSETPEDATKAKKLGIQLDEDSCRIWTRQNARQCVPDILVTNYSMLEYMLCRPQDTPFFGTALRAIVLDEAHLYTGTLAAEMTLLLRRVLLRCGRKPEEVLHLATSATIGTDDEQKLKEFAAKLFSKDISLVEVIRGQHARVEFGKESPPCNPVTVENVRCQNWQIKPTIELDKLGTARLASDKNECDRLAKSLAVLVSETCIKKALSKCEEKPAFLLHDTLRYSPVIKKLEAILWELRGTPLKLSDLSQKLWGRCDSDACEATAVLLRLGASARTDIAELPLIPHRIHLLARPCDGFVVCCNANCTGDKALKFSERLGCVIQGHTDHCLYCRAKTLTLVRCETCGEAALAGYLENGDYRPVLAYELYNKRFRLEVLENLHIQSPRLDAQGKILSSGFCQVNDRCPNCGKADWKPVVSSVALTLSIIAETALAELPEYPSEKNLWLPARGRRLLAFSDNRTEAARLGVQLRWQHERQVFRSILAKAVAESSHPDGAVITDIEDEISNLKNKLTSDSLSDLQRIRIEDRITELEKEKTKLKTGISVKNLRNFIVNSKDLLNRLSEIIDYDSSGKHKTDEWSQQRWEMNRRRIIERLEFQIGCEIAESTHRFPTLECIGLIQVGYPGIENILIPEALIGSAVPTNLARRNIEEHWVQLLSVLCDDLRSCGVVTLGEDNADAEYWLSGKRLGKWAAKFHSGWQLERFVGETMKQERRRFAAAFLRRCGLEEAVEEKAAQLLEYVFDALQQAAAQNLCDWLETAKREASNGSPVDGIRIRFPGLTVRRPEQLFRCETTNYLFTRCVLGIAPDSDLSKELKPINRSLEADPSQDLRYGRQRREYLDSKVFSLGLWSEEHSAQLAPEENRRLQDLFKAGVRNILSSTTTLELGIDIGGLTAVLMSNVPPGKVNYLQRAGRAGRRADGSSLVLTFVRPRPFDREVFVRFDEYLKKPLRSPRVFLERKRIVRRHMHAFWLGEFFRCTYLADKPVGAMNAFGNMGVFCGLPLVQKWEKGCPPPSLRESNTVIAEQFSNFVRDHINDSQYDEALQAIVHATAIEDSVADRDKLCKDLIQDFEKAIAEWKADYENLLKVWEAAIAKEKRAMANAIYYQLKQLYNTTVIEALADKQFLPRYGFPIGLMHLKVIAAAPGEPARIREEDQFRLERPGLLALGEYVPGSHLLVGGKLITSRGVLKHWTGENLDESLGRRGYYATCTKGHVFYEKNLSKKPDNCAICNEPANSNVHHEFLIPKYGFSTAVWDPPKTGGNIETIGQTQQATVTFRLDQPATKDDFGGILGLLARYKEDGEIFVYNNGEYNQGFVICLHCGYAESDRDKKLPKSFQEHAPLHLAGKGKYQVCKGAQQPLRRQTLAACQTTDALLLDFSRFTHRWQTPDVILTTLGYALQNAGARLLGLDSRELGVLSLAQFGIVLYDNVPGGAGHVFELLNIGRPWLEAACKQMFINAEHHRRCETACLDCLLTFDAQTSLSQGLLNRLRAYEVLDALLKKVASVEEADGEGEVGVPDPRKTKEERLRRRLRNR